MAHKRLLLTALTAIMAAATASFAQNAPFLVPANADGVIAREGNDFPDKIRMEGSDGIYTLTNQTLDGGFIFLGISATSAANYTEYAMPSWAVTPAITDYCNPLSISAGSIIHVAPGTYDVTFYDRNVTAEGNHMFLLKPTGTTSRAYPPDLYVIASSGAIKATQSADTAGYYTAITDMPSEMRISYEPTASYAIFIYGPATAGDNLLRSGEALPLAYNENTGIRLRPDATATGKSLLVEGQKVHIAIDLRTADAPTVTVANEATLSIDQPSADSDVEISVIGGRIMVSGADTLTRELYTPSGLCLYRSTGSDLGHHPSGIYIVRVGTTTAKIAVTQ